MLFTLLCIEIEHFMKNEFQQVIPFICIHFIPQKINVDVLEITIGN